MQETQEMMAGNYIASGNEPIAEIRADEMKVNHTRSRIERDGE